MGMAVVHELEEAGATEDMCTGCDDWVEDGLQTDGTVVEAAWNSMLRLMVAANRQRGQFLFPSLMKDASPTC